MLDRDKANHRDGKGMTGQKKLATVKQLAFMVSHGVSRNFAASMSRDTACQVIASIIEAKKNPRPENPA